jgi:hypothetical protein
MKEYWLKTDADSYVNAARKFFLDTVEKGINADSYDWGKNRFVIATPGGDYLPTMDNDEYGIPVDWVLCENSLYDVLARAPRYFVDWLYDRIEDYRF